MRTSDECIGKIKEFEGLRLEPYTCPGGKLTIGYGHTIGDTAAGGRTRISEDVADELLRLDLEKVEEQLTRYEGRLPEGRRLRQGEWDALASWVFNLGGARLVGSAVYPESTLWHHIRLGLPTADIQAQFRRWVYAGGRVQPGLERRREWEAARWASAD